MLNVASYWKGHIMMLVIYLLHYNHVASEAAINATGRPQSVGLVDSHGASMI